MRGQSNTLRTSPGPFFVLPFSHTYTYTHTPTSLTHMIQTQGNTSLFQQRSALCYALLDIRTCLAAFCSRRHCQLLQPLQARTKPRRCSRMRKSPSSVRSRTINTRRSLTETTATSPATANRSVTAAEQRRPLYVPNTKNNRNSTRP